MCETETERETEREGKRLRRKILQKIERKSKKMKWRTRPAGVVMPGKIKTLFVVDYTSNILCLMYFLHYAVIQTAVG